MAENVTVSVIQDITEITIEANTISLSDLNSSINVLNGLKPLYLPSENSPRLFMIFGQSNASGRGLNSDASSSELDETSIVQIWTGSAWENLDISSGNNQSIADKHGLELGLSIQYQEYFPGETLYLVKDGYPGTSIDDHLTVYYSTATTKLLNAFNNLVSNGITPRIYLIFLQGEADSTAGLAALYYDKLSELISKFDAFINVKTPFITPEVLSIDSNYDLVNTSKLMAQKGRQNVFLIESSNENTSDNLHYNYTGLKHVSDKILNKIRHIQCVPIHKIGNISLTEFVSTWVTTNTGTSNSNQITLPLESTGNYSFVVDWGDGNTDTILAYNQSEVTHTYAASGQYTVRISGLISGFRFNNAGDKGKITNISNWGPLELGPNGYNFYGCSNLTITATDALNNLTFLSYAFRGCTSLTSLDASAWDTSAVYNMRYAFYGCTSLASLDVSTWDTSSVTDMSYMFRSCSSLTTLDLSAWDVSSVTNMSNVFYGCTGLTSVDVSTWDVSSATNMSQLFRGCTSLVTLDVSNWDTSSVTNMSYLFANADLLTSIAIDQWDVTAVTNFGSFMASHDGLTTGKYDQVLIAWASQAVNTGLTIDFGGSKYTAGGAAATARNTLTSTKGWTIIDGGSI